MTAIQFPANFFVHAVEIDTDRQNGVTLSKQKEWLAEHGYVEKEDWRHCGTKQRVINVDIESGSGIVANLKKAQFNRFRFHDIDTAIHFKTAWG